METQPAQPEVQPNGALMTSAQSVELAIPSLQSGKTNSQSATADSQSGTLDPTYGCSRFICCPSIDTSPSVAAFNRDMSSVRESVEWSFVRVKALWGFLYWDKKSRVRQTAVGNLFFSPECF
ncbi:hypothetical protein JG687_00014926 [Phytophthora cactorum]|uniref:Uncharacterized protein n=1 Tax=Phytophthora cactorum TaxID=29920 RepID=A0A8T1TUR1_9STRA|nr:hypothetical protein JG687_00014926 [Phytophthora cactorum]